MGKDGARGLSVEIVAIGEVLGRYGLKGQAIHLWKIQIKHQQITFSIKSYIQACFSVVRRIDRIALCLQSLLQETSQRQVVFYDKDAHLLSSRKTLRRFGQRGGD